MITAEVSRPPGPPWTVITPPGWPIVSTGSAWRLRIPATPAGRYVNAQVDDYQGRARRDFLWRPPLRLTVRARFSHAAGALRGTAGFGFWNDPFLMTGWRLPALPQAIWFFYASPESDMPLALDVPGHGWKAACIDAIRPAALLLAPFAPLAVPLLRIPRMHRRLWPLAQRALGVSEALIAQAMTGWHTYVLDWGLRRAEFRVDDRPVLIGERPPRGPLGFVLWIDNQALVATPQGRLRWRALPLAEPQTLEIDRLQIEPPG